MFKDVLHESGITFTHHFLDTETGSTYKINPYDHGSGVYAVDVNGDGLDDIYFLDFLGPNALYINKGGMRFEDATAGSGVDVPRALSVGAAFGDYDDDGDADLYVTTYRGGNHLFRSNGDGTFEDVTETSNTGYTGHSNSATWFDYDGDGDLDLYLCNIGIFTTGTISREANYFYKGEALPFTEVAKTPDRRVPGEADVLFRNDGGGKFTDVTAAAGIASAEWNGDIAVADIDLDGDLDFYTSNMFGANHLYLNNGDGTFEDVTRSALGRTSWGGMGARFFDANGDAYPDLYVVDMHSDMWIDPKEGAKGWEPDQKFNTPLGAIVGGGKIIEKPEDTQAKSVLFGNTFFVNEGDGTFTERSAEAGLENWWPWGITVGDYNNDGAQDVFVTGGMGFPFVYWPNHLYLGNGKGRFYEVAAAAGVEPPRLGEILAGAAINGREFTRSSRTAATADFDRDGDLDIVVNNFNHEPYLLRNDSPRTSGGNWLQLDLRLAGSRRPAFGARVVVKAGGKTWHRRVTGAEGYLTQSSTVVHVGLGSVTSIDTVEVYWLGTDEPQVVHAPAANQRIEIVQE
ncbi:MAG: CRTAC1 family protein [Planctomycetota bacterium]|nr:MAG: CRTAC1 family protein [Planctomycetota bacterium]